MEEQGFTLQEIMVAMFISSLMMSISLSLFLFSSRLFKKWHEENDFTSAVHRTVQIVSYDIERSEEVVSVSDSVLVLQNGDEANIRYTFDGKRALKNDIDLFSKQDGECNVTIAEDSLPNGRVYHITATGISGANRCEARCDASVPYSSASEFHRVM